VPQHINVIGGALVAAADKRRPEAAAERCPVPTHLKFEIRKQFYGRKAFFYGSSYIIGKARRGKSRKRIQINRSGGFSGDAGNPENVRDCGKLFEQAGGKNKGRRRKAVCS
jgi:hypothetical protein